MQITPLTTNNQQEFVRSVNCPYFHQLAKKNLTKNIKTELNEIFDWNRFLIYDIQHNLFNKLYICI